MGETGLCHRSLARYLRIKNYRIRLSENCRGRPEFVYRRKIITKVSNGPGREDIILRQCSRRHTPLWELVKQSDVLQALVTAWGRSF